MSAPQLLPSPLPPPVKRLPAVPRNKNKMAIQHVENRTTFAGLLQAVASITQSCRALSSTIRELQEGGGEIGHLLSTLSEELKALRRIDEGLHGCLKQVGSQFQDAKELQSLWEDILGTVEDCERYMRNFNTALTKTKPKGPSYMSQSQSNSIEENKDDLEKALFQIHSHKLNLNICFTMLVLQICLDLVANHKYAGDISAQISSAKGRLEQAIDKQPMPEPNGSVNLANHYRLKESSEKVLDTAQLIFNRQDQSFPSKILDVGSLSLRDDNRQSITNEERFGLESLIHQLNSVSEDKDQPIEYRPMSMLPEVCISPGRTLVPDDARMSGTTATTADIEFDDFDDDDFDKELVELLNEQGRVHFDNQNYVQANECLTRALEHASRLSDIAYHSLDFTELRSILATILLHNKDLTGAQQHCLALLQDSPPTEANSPLIAKAYYQLAQISLVRRNYGEAQSYVKKALSLRARMYGKQSAQYYEALKLLVLIFHSEGHLPEADVTIRKLPEELREMTRREMQQQSRSFEFVKPSSPGTVVEKHKLPSAASFSKYRGHNTSIDSNVQSVRVPSYDSRAQTSRFPSYDGRKAPQPDLQLSPASNDSGSGSGSIIYNPLGLNKYKPASIGRNSSNAQRTQSAPIDQNSNIMPLLADGGFVGDFDASKALAWAIKLGHVRVVHLLVEGYPVVRPKRRFALGSEETSVIKSIGIDGGPKDKVAPVVQAIIHAQVLIVKFLLEKGAAITTKDEKGRTPLLIAAELGQVEIINLLLDKGAETKWLDGRARQWTPWHAAAQQGHVDVLRLFLQRGASINARDVSGSTALKIAASRGYLPACQLLVECHANKDLASDDGSTALISSVRSGHSEVTLFLLRHRPDVPDVNIKNGKGQTALNIAAYEGREEETRMLLDSEGISLEIADDKGWTALMTAARYARVVIVQLLIQAGANVNAHCPRNSTPLDHAVRAKNKAVEKFVRDAGGYKGSGLTEPHVQINDAFKGYGGF